MPSPPNATVVMSSSTRWPGCKTGVVSVSMYGVNPIRGRLRLQTARAGILQDAVTTGQRPDPPQEEKCQPERAEPGMRAKVLRETSQLLPRAHKRSRPPHHQHETGFRADHLQRAPQPASGRERAQTRQHEIAQDKA